MSARCMNCLNLIEQTQGLCPKCGKPLQVFNEPPALGVSTVLHQRYLIGAKLFENGEGFTYMAYDMLEDKPVHLVEFFPQGKVTRGADGLTMNVPSQNEQSCLEWISQFIGMYQKLKSMGSTNCIVPCLDLFDENETVYAVTSLPAGKRTLQQYLDEYFDILSWKQAEFLFGPLIYGLSGLNGAGIGHYGLCPDNLSVDEKGKVRLYHFAIPQVRSVGSSLQHELYSGYSAPEQYIVDGEIGEWTDVYAFCALLYRVLTGQSVPKGNSRAVSDALTDPRNLNPDIPEAVSRAIIAGLAPAPESRIRTFKELLYHLYNEMPIEEMPKQEVQGKTIVIPAMKETDVPAKKEHRFVEDRKGPVSHSKPKVPVALLVLIIALPVALALFGLVYALLLGGSDGSSSSGNVSYLDGINPITSSETSGITSSEPDSEGDSSSAGIEVENFVDRYYIDIENNAVYATLYHFTAVYQYDDTVEKGKIISQSIKPDTVVPKGEAIEFAVSKGSQFYTLPSMTDGTGKRKTADAYAAELSAAGIPYKMDTIESSDYAEGKVVKLSMDVGSQIDLENPSTVTIFAAKAPQVDSSDIFHYSSDSEEGGETILGDDE